eukprot:2752342-Pleurochrysis_carterae.AAC.1
MVSLCGLWSSAVGCLTTPAPLRAGKIVLGASGTPSLSPTRSVATSSSSTHSRAAVPSGLSVAQSSPRLQPLAAPPLGGCATA